MTNYVIKLNRERFGDMRVCVCVCVCVREREREKERKKESILTPFKAKIDPYQHYDKWAMINKSVAKDLSSILISIKIQ